MADIAFWYVEASYSRENIFFIRLYILFYSFCLMCDGFLHKGLLKRQNGDPRRAILLQFRVQTQPFIKALVSAITHMFFVSDTYDYLSSSNRSASVKMRAILSYFDFGPHIMYHSRMHG